MNLDENLMVYDDENTDAEYFYVHDGLGTVRQIVDSSQTVQNSYDYEGFGTGVSQTENIYNRFRYTGREYDAETEATANDGTGLYNYRARTYDSTIGSFTSRDPLPAVNYYSYCFNNPIINIDSYGLSTSLYQTNLRGFETISVYSTRGTLRQDEHGKHINTDKQYNRMHFRFSPSSNNYKCDECCKFGWVQFVKEAKWQFDNPGHGESSPYEEDGETLRTEINLDDPTNPWYGGPGDIANVTLVNENEIVLKSIVVKRRLLESLNNRIQEFENRLGCV